MSVMAKKQLSQLTPEERREQHAWQCRRDRLRILEIQIRRSQCRYLRSLRKNRRGFHLTYIEWVGPYRGRDMLPRGFNQNLARSMPRRCMKESAK